MKKFLLLGVFMAFGVLLFAQTQIYLLDFESSGGYSTSQTEQSDGQYDYFTRTDGTNIDVNFTDIQGSSFFAAQDLDADGMSSPAYLTINDININGYTSLELKIYLAEDDDGSDNDWDVSDFLHIDYDIDNSGTFSNGIWVENNGSTYNSAPFIDTNYDGTGEGTEITDAFAQFTKALSGTGSVLDIKITFGGLTSSEEDIAIDHIEIYGVAPLPIILTSFTANPRANQVSLSWETATEINNDYFTIERSTDGQRFEAIGTVAGAGNSTTTQKYAFFDKTPMRGTNYYRLAQTDYDGQSETFDVVSVDFKGTGTTTIRPTQVKDIMTLSLEPMETVGRVTIFNLVGQRVYDAVIDAGSSSMEIDAATFAHGQYFARVANGNFVETVRFIKQ